jgi:hypothetical protein
MDNSSNINNLPSNNTQFVPVKDRARMYDAKVEAETAKLQARNVTRAPVNPVSSQVVEKAKPNRPEGAKEPILSREAVSTRLDRMNPEHLDLIRSIVDDILGPTIHSHPTTVESRNQRRAEQWEKLTPQDQHLVNFEGRSFVKSNEPKFVTALVKIWIPQELKKHPEYNWQDASDPSSNPIKG